MDKFRDWLALYRMWLLYMPLSILMNLGFQLVCKTQGWTLYWGKYDLVSGLSGILTAIILVSVIGTWFNRRVDIVGTRMPYLWPRHWWKTEPEDFIDDHNRLVSVTDWSIKRKQPFFVWTKYNKGEIVRYYGFRSADLMVECRMTV